MNGGTPTSLSSIDRGFATHQGVCIIGQVPHVPSGRALRDLPGTLGQTLGACIIHDHRSGAVRIVRREDPARDAGEARTRRRESEGEDWKRHVVVSPGCEKPGWRRGQFTACVLVADTEEDGNEGLDVWK